MALLSNIFQKKITTIVPGGEMSPEASIVFPPVSITATGWEKSKIELVMMKEAELD